MNKDIALLVKAGTSQNAPIVSSIGGKGSKEYLALPIKEQRLIDSWINMLLKAGYSYDEMPRVFQLAQAKYDELKKRESMSNSKIKIYVAGRVSGEDYQQAFDKFQAIEDTLIGFGYQVINPMKLVPKGTNWDDAMDICKPHVLNADVIFFLQDWQQSYGAQLEHHWAFSNEVEIVYYHQLSERLAKQLEHATLH